jgi:uncharacterized membrane-anchored protein
MGGYDFMKTKKLVGLVLLFAGLAILITGIVQYTQFQGSVVGKISGVIGDLGGGKSDQEMQYIIMMIGGGICALCGIVVAAAKK